MEETGRLLCANSDGTLGFGDFSLPVKTKKEDYEFQGDLYKVKTFSEITRLERNGLLVFESVPGSAAENFRMTSTEVSFTLFAKGDVQVTLGLEPESEYEVMIGGLSFGKMKTNLSGKLSISVEANAENGTKVSVRR